MDGERIDEKYRFQANVLLQFSTSFTSVARMDNDAKLEQIEERRRSVLITLYNRISRKCFQHFWKFMLLRDQ